MNSVMAKKEVRGTGLRDAEIRPFLYERLSREDLESMHRRLTRWRADAIAKGERKEINLLSNDILAIEKQLQKTGGKS